MKVSKDQQAFPVPSLKQTGEQFPDVDFNYSEHGNSGITIRQYYAAKAVQGILAADWFHSGVDGKSNENFIVKTAFKVADEMIKFENEET